MSLEGEEDRGPAAAALRAGIAAALVLLAFSVVVFRLWTGPLREGPEFREKSRNNFFQFKRLEHARGEILDREGRTLVTNRPSVNVYVTPAFFPQTRRMLAELGAIAGLSKKASLASGSLVEISSAGTTQIDTPSPRRV